MAKSIKLLIIFTLCVPFIFAAENPGRMGYRERWKEISDDPKQPRWLRGYLKNLFRQGKLSGITKHTGYQLQHSRGLEARKGFSYLFSVPNLKSNHKIQHRHDKYGRLLRGYVPKPIADYMKQNPGDLKDIRYQREVRDHLKNWIRDNERQTRSRGNTGRGTGGSGSGQGGGEKKMELSKYRKEHESTAKRYQQSNNIKYNQHMSAPRAGGVELLSSIPFRYNNYKVKSVHVNSTSREVVVKSKGLLWEHTCKMSVDLLEPDELLALEAAVRQTTREGLLLSLQIGHGTYKRTLDGLRFNTAARNKLIETLEEADFHLVDLVFGKNVRESRKTTSPVETYRNPFDVRLELMDKCANSSQTLDDDDDEDDSSCSNVMDIFSKFSNIDPFPTFQINSEGSWAECDINGQLQIKGDPLLKINMRGIYTDWVGTVYYDDSAQNCIAEKPFLRDFKNNYLSYKSKYPVFARLDQYAAVVALLLMSPPEANLRQFETHVEQTINNGTSLKADTRSELVTDIREWVAAQQEELVGRDNDTMVTIYQIMYLSNSWFNLNGFQQSFEAASVVLYYGIEILALENEFPQQSLVKVFIAKALLKIAEIIDKFNLQPDDLQYIENFIFNHSEQLVVNATSLVSKVLRERLIVNRALDLAMQIAIEVDDWSTAYLIEYYSITRKLDGIEITSSDLDHIWMEHLRRLKTNVQNSMVTRGANATISLLSCVWLEIRNVSRPCIDVAVKNSTLPDFMEMLENMPEDTPVETLLQLAGYIFYVESLVTHDKQEAISLAKESRRSFKDFAYLKLIATRQIFIIQQQFQLELKDEEIYNCLNRSTTLINMLTSMSESVPNSAINDYLQCAFRGRQNWMGRKMLDVLAVDKSIIVAYQISRNEEKAKQWQRILAIDILKYERSKNLNAK